jgi:carboxyl-terminal processing protease
MKWLASILMLAFAMGPAQAQVDAPYVRLFDTLWSTVNDNYYDPHFRGHDWAAVRPRYAARARAVRNDAEFAALGAAMLREIGSSHLSLGAPARLRNQSRIGARVEQIGGAAVITDVPFLSHAWRQGLRPGHRLVAGTDGLSGNLGTLASVTIERCDGARAEASVRREQAYWPLERPGFRWRQIRTGIDTRVGYIRVDRFDDGAAELADRAMAELAETKAIIIDLRENPGGNASALRLASYFAPGAEPAVVLLARPYLTALGRPPTAADIAAVTRVNGAYTDAAIFGAVASNNGGVAFWTDALPNRYTRPVFVLISPRTGSAAEGFAWYMRLRTHARLIGRPTAGALLSAQTFPIGEGWSVTVPVHGLWGPDGRDYGDQAVPPHVAVEWQRDDYCTGRDPDLEAAFRLIDSP